MPACASIIPVMDYKVFLSDLADVEHVISVYLEYSVAVAEHVR